MDRIEFTLGKLNKLGLIYRTKGAYVGYTLNYAGYDCLSDKHPCQSRRN